MASQAEIDEPPPRRSARRVGCLAALAVAALIAIALLVAWANREGIAGNVIGSELEKRGIQATYEIESIGPRRQVLRNIVVGDPRRPDLTVERAETIIRYRFGYPAIEEIRLVRPRLYGTYRNGTLSFGSLDKLLFGGPKRAFELPDLALALTDGRALLETDYGPIGIKAEGSGYLRDGFAGMVAATAPRLALGGCDARGATLYGQVKIRNVEPAFEGPLRLASLACPQRQLTLERATLQLDASADKAIRVFEGEAAWRSGRAAYGGNRLATLTGDTRFTWRDGGLTARYRLAGTGLDTSQAAIGRLALDGSLRARGNFERIEIDADVDGQGVRLGRGLDASLAGAARSTGDTLLGPLIERVRRALAAESRSSRLAGEVTLRRTDGSTAVSVPSASLRGSSGATLLALSRLQGTIGANGVPRFAGNFATGGANLPRIAGRMEQQPDGRVQARLSMAEYTAGASRLAIPQLALVQGADGSLGFSGQARASGALPGGFAQNLQLPLSGNWSPARGLVLWRECTNLRFDSLRFANLTLERKGLTLCPPTGRAIVQYGGGGLRIAAGAPSLDVAGRLGETPIAIRSGAVGLAWPGALSARQLVVTLGPAGTATTFAIEDLTANIGKDVAGRFGGTDVRLYAVPLDLLGASGEWRYAGERLSLTGGAFRLEDRQEPDRFSPLAAEGATLALENNRITAEALLREPASGRTVTHVDLVHDLGTGRGSANLAVPGLTFGPGFQPDTLFPAAFGLVANVRGTVAGTGRIAWDEGGVTSTGRFSTDSLDFAAAFGPVKGASGTVEFTDLLGLTTAPNQRLHVASINPGIEVTDGDILFQLRGGQVLAFQGGTFPFMGGTLTIRPLDINFGVSEERRFVLEIEGLDAARFVERMDLENISATGIFDGTVPLVFDAAGNGHVVGGLLVSRPPGGNVSYVGQLTYENLGAMGNYAFDMLRSIDYRQMSIELNGDLTGEIVASVGMDGVSQGATAGTTFVSRIVRRAIAGLPVRLVVNIRAPFYSLLGTVRAMYDPAAIRDPRDVGLLDAQGNPIRRESRGDTPPAAPDIPVPEDLIQHRESEETP